MAKELETIPMHWEPATEEAVNLSPFGQKFLVKTNGGEWRDTDLHVMGSFEIKMKLSRTYVRGRPLYMARITDPLGD